MKIKSIVKQSIMLLAMVSFIPAMATAKPGKGIRNDRPFQGIQHRSISGIWNHPQLAQELKLTDDQTEKLKNLDFAAQEKQMELRNQLEALGLKMRQAFAEETINDKNILSLAQQISEIQGNLFVQRIESQLAVGKVLDDDQLKKLKSYRFQGKRRPMGDDRRQKGDGNGRRF
jgi:Spy/CpxP family protein refolding chaperone